MIFVTGGSGLLGQFLIRELVSRNLPVKALFRNQIPFQHDRVNWVEGDIADTELLFKEFGNCTHVFHCAGVVSYAPQDAALLQQVNVEGTANVVDACLSVPEIKLCHVSSVAAIGKSKKNTVLDETAKWDESIETSAYALSKHLAELEVWRGISEGLNAVIVNPSVILGPADWTKSSTRLFKYVYDQKPFYTAGATNFVDVRDVVEVMIELNFSDISGERFIVNAGPMEYKAFFDRISEKLQKKAPRIRVGGSITEVIWRLEHVLGMVTGRRPLITKDTARITKNNFTYANNKIKKALNFEFRPLEETIDWSCEMLLKQTQKIESV